MPVIMMTPISDMTLSVVPVASRKSTTPAARWDGQQDDERIGERSELGHQDEVDENDGQD